MPKKRKKGARFSDIAERAGVGIATVDRVLNDRGNVSPATALKVIQAARALGVNRLVPSPYRKRLRYKIVLARRRFGFAERLNQAFIKSAGAFAKSITLERSFVEEEDSASLEREIAGCAGTYDGVIVLPVNTPEVRRAIREISPTVPVVTIVTDVDDDARHAFVGIDNIKAGRTAGYLCSSGMGPDSHAAALWLGPAFTGQGERVSGFADYFIAHRPDVRTSRHIVEPATSEACYALTRQLIRATPNLAALYNAGVYDDSVIAGIHADAAAAAIDAEGKAAKIQYVGHELTEGNARLLQDGVLNFAIDQNPDQQALRALEILLHIHGLIEHESLAGQTEFRIYCRENIAAPV